MPEYESLDMGHAMLEVGVPNLDRIMGGGIPAGSSILVVGPAGAGKTTLTMQIGFCYATGGRRVIFLTTTSETPARLIGHIRQFGFYREEVVGKQLLMFSLYPMVKDALRSVLDRLISEVKKSSAELLILDGFMTLRDLHPQVMEHRSFLFDLTSTLAALGCTTLITTGDPEGNRSFRSFEYTMVDGVLELGWIDQGGRTRRTIRVIKMRGQAPLLGEHTLRIAGPGMQVYPRLESVQEFATDVGVGEGRAPFELAELDVMMGGGPTVRSVTLIAGALATGKTLLCLQFLMSAVRHGERAMMVSFGETPGQMLDTARRFHIDLKPALDDGRMTILYFPPVELLLDEVAEVLREKLEQLQPSRLVIDGIALIEQALAIEGRGPTFLACIAAMLRRHRVTALVTRELRQAVGPELDVSETPLAALAENLILLRFVEYYGELHRILSVLKMGASEYDPSIRQYVLEREGLRVLPRAETAEGVLAGITRLVTERQTRRGRKKREEDA